MRFLPLLALASLFAACAHRPPVEIPPAPLPPIPRLLGAEPLRSELNALLKQPFSETRSVDVIYATNRVPAGSREDCSDESFGVAFSDQLLFGVCRISVPKRHAVGALPAAPSPGADPQRYFRALSHMRLEAGTFGTLISRTQPADLLLFVHGFNMKFGEAVLRAAQIAYDLRFQGPVLLFSWPAGSEEGLFSGAMLNRTYESNRANARRSVTRFGNFLRLLDSLNVKTHVLVHSMGHQIALRALAEVAATDVRRPVGELILNAPDISLDVFFDLLPKLKKVADRITVYCSYNDRAISASESYNEDRRMGACERMPGVDVINVGEIDASALGLGHGYYASRPILTDIFQTLLGISAENRLFVRKSEPGAAENYFLRP